MECSTGWALVATLMASTWKAMSQWSIHHFIPPLLQVGCFAAVLHRFQSFRQSCGSEGSRSRALLQLKTPAARPASSRFTHRSLSSRGPSLSGQQATSTEAAAFARDRRTDTTSVFSSATPSVFTERDPLLLSACTRPDCSFVAPLRR